MQNDIIYLYENFTNEGVKMKNDSREENTQTFEPAVSSYYEGVSVAFRYAKFITLTIAVLFVILTLSFFREDVSIENFQYMLKYITSEEDTLITTQKLHYPTSDSKALTLFNGDLVSAGTGGISLYDTNGSSVLQIDEVYSSPYFSIGNRYGLCYDMSGHSFVIFSTFAKLHSEKLDYPISGAKMTDKGSYVIMTRDREYKTVFNVYNSDYELVSRIFKNNYTFAFDYNGKHLAYASVSASDSRFVCELSVVKANSDSEISKLTYYDEFPVALKYMNGSLAFLTDKSLRFYDDKNEVIKEYNIESQISGYSFADNFMMIYSEKNIIGSENEARFYSGNGDLISKEAIKGKINSVDLRDNCSLILTNNTVIRLDFDVGNARICKIDTGAERALLQSDNTALVCYDNFAQLVDFESANEIYKFGIMGGINDGTFS